LFVDPPPAWTITPSQRSGVRLGHLPLGRAYAREGVRSGAQSAWAGPVDLRKRRAPRAWASGRTGRETMLAGARI